MIRVVKCGTKVKRGAVRFYVGRKSSAGRGSGLDLSVLGNPFRLGRYSRAESIERYEVYLREEVEKKNANVCSALNRVYLAARKGDVELECFCKPLACHGDVIKKVVEEKL